MLPIFLLSLVCYGIASPQLFQPFSIPLFKGPSPLATAVKPMITEAETLMKSLVDLANGKPAARQPPRKPGFKKRVEATTAAPSPSTTEKPAETFNSSLITPVIVVDPMLKDIDENYAKCNGIDIRELSVLSIQELFEDNQLTSVDLVKCYLERLDKMNNVLRVVVEVNPDALDDARKLDDERREGKDRGAMHGIPVLLKDGIGTLDKTQNTAGSPAFVGLKPVRDAPVVNALRQAGAVILGKSHAQELYGIRGSNIPNGWSGRGGQTRNPYNINTTPSGSSSGSAVGVGANLIPVAVGTETDGSILEPAALSGLVGLKPTIGFPSVDVILPVSKSYDHVGPMAKTVTDAAVLLDGMVQDSERPSNHPRSYTEDLLENKNKRPFRIGVVRNPFWNTNVIASDHLKNQVQELNKTLKQLNTSPDFEVVDPINEDVPDVTLHRFFNTLLFELKDGLNKYLKNDVVNEYSLARPNNAFTKTPESYYSSVSPYKRIKSLEDVITYNKEHPTVQGFNQEYLELAQGSDGLQNQTYIDSRDINNANARAYFEKIFKKHRLDAIVTPTAGESRGSTVTDSALADFPVFGYTMACITGYPSITVPAGIGFHGVPYGLTFIAKPFQEPDLLRMAYTAEQFAPKRQMPKFYIEI